MNCFPQAVQIFQLVEPFTVNLLDILIADEHIELFVSDKSFFFCQIILEKGNYLFFCNFFCRELDSEVFADIIQKLSQTCLAVVGIFIKPLVQVVLCRIHDAF